MRLVYEGSAAVPKEEAHNPQMFTESLLKGSQKNEGAPRRNLERRVLCDNKVRCRIWKLSTRYCTSGSLSVDIKDNSTSNSRERTQTIPDPVCDALAQKSKALYMHPAS